MSGREIFLIVLRRSGIMYTSGWILGRHFWILAWRFAKRRYRRKDTFPGFPVATTRYYILHRIRLAAGRIIYVTCTGWDVSEWLPALLEGRRANCDRDYQKRAEDAAVATRT